jgi:prepilin-type processing-associated H-X9-DG protein
MKRLCRFAPLATVLAICLLCSRAPAQATKPAPASKPSAFDAVMKHAPEGAGGVIHVEPRALARELLPALAKDPEFKHWDPNTLAAIGSFFEKIDSLDLFQSADVPDRKAGLPFLLVIHGSLKAADTNSLLRALQGRGGGDAIQKKGDAKGRYEFDSADLPLEFVFGGEANELPPGVVIAGTEAALSAKSLAALGKGNRDDLAGLFQHVDPAAPVWGAARKGLLHFWIWGHDGPDWFAFSLHPTGGAPLRAAMEFADANSAARYASDLAADANAGDGWAALLTKIAQARVDGNRLTLAGRSKDSLVPAIVSAWADSSRAEKRDTSIDLLREIGGEMIVYSADHDDMLPADLLVMVKEKALPAGALVSPASGRSVKTDAKGMPQAGFEPDYVCVKHTLPIHKIKDPKSKVLAYERPENYRDDGTAVLYVDGHVEYVKLEEFRRQLKATEDWIAAQGKS